MIHDPRGPRRRGCRSRGGALMPRDRSRGPSSSQTTPFRVWMPLDSWRVVWLFASAPQARHGPVCNLLRLFCARIGVARMRGSRSRLKTGEWAIRDGVYGGSLSWDENRPSSIATGPVDLVYKALDPSIDNTASTQPSIVLLSCAVLNHHIIAVLA